MDEQQRQIVEDLRGVLKGEIRCDPLMTSMYSTDGSLYQIRPLGVAFPHNHEDVCLLASYALEWDIPLIGRGGGSGVAGQALGNGLIVDFSRHMRRIEEIGEETVRVQPGLVRDRLNYHLRPYGRYFAPDPSNSAVTTVGGMLAVDAAGSHSPRVGSARDHTESMRLVLPGGQSITAGDESLRMLKTAPPSRQEPEPFFEPAAESASRDDDALKRTLVSKLAKLLSDNAALIDQYQPSLARNCCGYNLRQVLNGRHLNLPRLLVGSEGTLGLWTEATLNTSPLPAHRGVVLLLFGSMDAAVQAVQVIAGQQPSACDLLDRRLLSLGREADPRFASLIAPACEAALIVEQTGFSDRQVRDRIRMAVEAVRRQHSSVVVAKEAYRFEDVEFLWSMPRKVVPLLTRLKGPTRPLPFVEDVVVPPPTLQDFLIRAQKVFQKHQVTASLYAHAASGQLHLRPFLQPENGRAIQAIARDLYQVVFSVGGSISGEHGDGLSRTAFIRSQYGPLYKVFQEIKDLFDPHNLMNPGKIVSDDPHLTMRNLRPAAVPSQQVTELQLQWNPAEVARETALCNGCGVCKTQGPEARMCPFFHAEPWEGASPRSKANLLRNYLSGLVQPEEITSGEMKDLADLCFNCKQCQLECPSNVNIPQLMIEAKAAYAAVHGLSRADWILSRAHSFGALGCSAPWLANRLLSNRPARWVMEKVLGIARQRKLPRFARRSFLRSIPRRLMEPPSGNGGGKPVVYFVDHYANYHDPELARAFLAILEHNGIPVYIPPGQTASGMAMISAGDLEPARELAEQNVRTLAEWAREGHTIVCTEPAAALCLGQEYPKLLDHPDVETVAEHVLEAGTFLQQLREAGKLRLDFGPVEAVAGYHTPCHLRALTSGTPLERLLTLIPGLQVHKIEEGCSGMAGAYGLTRENFRTSVRIGWNLISRMRGSDLQIGTTECSSCKIQMEQGTTTPTLHPLKLLALSYGLDSKLQERLIQPSKQLVVS